jgi:CubicO group peptidase (beta-lactamase class C family)
MPKKNQRIHAVPLASGRFLLLVLLGALVPTPASSQAPDLARLDADIAEAKAEWPVPGLAVAIVKDGQTVFAKGYGVRTAGDDTPVNEHTLFAIASNTKAFTSAALAMLVEEGKLTWDDPVRQHLPYFQLYDPYVSQEMRIRDLLSHRSGLGTYSGDLLWYGTDYSAEEVIRRARHLDPAGLFRGSYGYSNLMFIAAGEIVSGASGVPWPEFVRGRILRPLGMSRTVLSVSELPTRDNVASPHKNLADGVVAIDWYGWDAMAAAGGIISSVSEMTEWLKLQLGRGQWNGHQLFTEESSWEMWTVHNPRRISPQQRRTTPSTHFRGYGLGWELKDYLGRLVVSHGGGYDGMFSRVVLVPEEGLGVVVLTNSMTSLGTALANHVVDVFLGAEEQDWSRSMLASFETARQRFETRQAAAGQARVSGTRPSLALEEYAGTYGGALYGDGTVSVEDGNLVLRLLPNSDLVADLTHLHHDTFFIQWRDTFAWFGPGTATFILDASGEVDEVRLDVPNDDFWFHELELKRRVP